MDFLESLSLINILKHYVLVVGIYAILFIAVEYIKPVHDNKKYLQSDNKVEILYPLLELIFMPLKLVVVVFLTVHVFDHYLPYQIFETQIAEMNLGLQTLIGLFVLDFALYVRHRFVHQYCWPYHAIHHSAKQLTWLTTNRLHPVDVIVMGGINAAILYILGFGTEGIVLASGIRVAWNYFVHCNIHLVFPSFLHYIIASPHVHRWHHATDKEAINKNFTIMFCCIDYVFGTFYAPRDRFPKSLGLHDEATIPFKNNIFSHLVYPFKRHYYWVQKKKSKMKQKIEKESKA